MKIGAYTLILAVLLVLCACQSTKRIVHLNRPPLSELERAKYNLSGFQIFLNTELLPDEVTLVFFDANIKDATGMFFQEMHIIKNSELYVCRNVIAVDVQECIRGAIPISRVISHELVHYRQYKKMTDLGEFVNGYRAHPEIFEEEAYSSESDELILAVVGKRKTPEYARIALVSGFTEHNVSYKTRK